MPASAGPLGIACGGGGNGSRSGISRRVTNFGASPTCHESANEDEYLVVSLPRPTEEKSPASNSATMPLLLPSGALLPEYSLRRQWWEKEGNNRTRRVVRYCKFGAMAIVGLAGALAALILLSWLHCGHTDSKVNRASNAFVAGTERRVLSNGTLDFFPTVIMISIDGFRASYLSRNLTPNLVQFGRKGLRTDYLLPVFPSITFPNHYSIATGLYAESHGIVANSFYDTKLNATFYYKDSKLDEDPRWWGGEPIWVTAEKQGQRAGVNMWPGSTAPIKDTLPTYLHPYKSGISAVNKFNVLLDWIDNPDLATRPSLLMAYIPEVDSAGHAYGPDSPQVDAALTVVDDALGYMFAQIQARNLTHIVNIMIVSDHGMTSTIPERYTIFLDDLIDDISKVHSVHGWPIGSVVLKDPEHDTMDVYQQLLRAPLTKATRLKVFLREEIPERYHYSHNDRIGHIVVIPPEPYMISQRYPADARLADTVAGLDTVIGLHGYDNLDPTMHAIFVADGPAFRSRHHVPARPPLSYSPSAALVGGLYDQHWEEPDGSAVPLSEEGAETTRQFARHPPVANIEIYGLICDILGLDPAPNNGTAGFSEWWLRTADS